MKIFVSIKNLTVFLIISQIIFPLPLFAEVVGKFAEVKGGISITRGKQSLTPIVEDKVQFKDIVTTADKSRAKIFLIDDSSVNIGRNSTLEINEYVFDGKKRSGVFSLKSGTISAKVQKTSGPDSKFEVRTPTAVAASRGTEWITTVESTTGGATFYALQNSVAVSNPQYPDQTVVINPGEYTTVGLGAPTAPAAFTTLMIEGAVDDLGIAGEVSAAGAGATAGAATTAGLSTGTIVLGAFVAGGIITAIISVTGSEGTTSHHLVTSHHSVPGD